MYLLFVDESGTHGKSSSFVLGGLAVHEEDAVGTQRTMERILARCSERFALELRNLEFHGAETKSPRGTRGAKRPSPWHGIRFYEPSVHDTSRIAHLWPRFDAADGHLHGAIHLTPDFEADACPCPPCNARTRGPPPLPALASHG
jgi:hypothetical protein